MINYGDGIFVNNFIHNVVMENAKLAII